MTTQLLHLENIVDQDNEKHKGGQERKGQGGDLKDGMAVSRNLSSPLV